MALEDFTTYTEVEPDDRIQATDDHIDFWAYRNEDARKYDDKGVGHFGDWEHLIASKFVTKSSPVHTPHGYFWMLANALDDVYNLTVDDHDFLALYMYSKTDANTVEIVLLESDAGAIYADWYNNPSGRLNWYYDTVKKAGTTMTVKIYSDPSRMTLVDTLALTLQHDYIFRYIYAANTRNDGVNNYIELDIDDLDLQEVAVAAGYAFIL